MKKTKKKTPIKPFTEEALAFFQEQNDSTEFMTEPTNGNYIDYLLGDTGYNAHEGILWIQSSMTWMIHLIGLWTRI